MSLARRALAFDSPRRRRAGRDDEREIQAAVAVASRVVDITPWILPLLLTVIVYAKQPPSPSLPLPRPLQSSPSPP